MQLNSDRIRSFPSKSITKITTQAEEQHLLSLLAQGKLIVFWPLWEYHQNYLYHRCISWMGGNSTEASEALSRAMLKAWEKLPKYAEKITHLKAWLTRMTHNLCVDMHRERQRQESSIVTITQSNYEAVIPGCQSPESEVLQKELEIKIHHAVEQLPPKLRETFVLRYFDELSYPEIAKQLAISNCNVRKRIQQAREYLQKQLHSYL